MTHRSSRQWIFSVGIPDQATQWASEQSEVVVTFDVSAVHRDSLSFDLFPYYWTDLVREVANVFRREDTNDLPVKSESCLLGRHLEDLVCRPSLAFGCYKEYPSVEKPFREILERLTNRFVKLVDSHFVHVHVDQNDRKCGLAIILNDQTDNESIIRRKLCDLCPLFQWNESTSCETSQRVDVKNEDENSAVKSYVERATYTTTARFFKLLHYPEVDSKCEKAYEEIWTCSETLERKNLAVDTVVVPCFMEIPWKCKTTEEDQKNLFTYLRDVLKVSSNINRIVFLMPSQLLVERSLNSLKGVTDFFTNPNFEGSLLKNDFKFTIKSYVDPAVRAISMMVIEIIRRGIASSTANQLCFTTVDPSHCHDLEETLTDPSATSRVKAEITSTPEPMDNSSTSKSADVQARDDDENSSSATLGLGTRTSRKQRTTSLVSMSRSVSDEQSGDESSEEEDYNETLASSPTNYQSTDGISSTNEAFLQMGLASASSRFQPQSKKFIDILDKVLSPKESAKNERDWKKICEQKKKEGGGKKFSRMKFDSFLAPLCKFLDDEQNGEFLNSKEEEKQLTWLQLALRRAVTAKGRGAKHVTQVLVTKGHFLSDEMPQESLLMTCLKHPSSSCEVASYLSNTLKIRPDERDSNKRTVLHWAVKRNLQPTVENICSSSAAELKQKKDADGKTPLDYAIELQRSLKSDKDLAIEDGKQTTGTNQSEASVATPGGKEIGALKRIAKIIETLEKGTVPHPKRPSDKKCESESKRRKKSGFSAD